MHTSMLLANLSYNELNNDNYIFDALIKSTLQDKVEDYQTTSSLLHWQHLHRHGRPDSESQKVRWDKTHFQVARADDVKLGHELLGTVYEFCNFLDRSFEATLDSQSLDSIFFFEKFKSNKRC